MYDPQDDDGRCHQCGRDYDSHTEEQHDECDLKSALDEMPNKGLRFLVYLNLEAMTAGGDYGAWEWTDLDGISSEGVQFVKMAVKNGEILEDLE